MLQPGTLDLVEFAPSNYYAYVEDVKYTVKIRPAHDMLPTTRIVIDMPEFLIFDRAAGCTVTYTECDCAFGALAYPSRNAQAPAYDDGARGAWAHQRELMETCYD